MADDPQPGDGASEVTRIGAYRIEATLGQGGMGEVYLARDERLGRHVALKRIRADLPVDERHRARFRREARAVARLSHPSIVQVFDLLETDDGDCLVMERVEGVSLSQAIARGEVDAALALRLGAEIADGLGEAHAKGLVHRDLKPDNVIVTPSGHAKILDFGLARMLWSETETKAGGVEEVSAALTQAGALVGTVHAMSPEQAGGRLVDHRSDLFALGGLLYEMLTGRAPFRGENLLDTLRRVTGEDPEPLAELRPDLPPEVVELVGRLLAKLPEDRPQNARMVADALERLRTVPDIVSRRDAVAPRTARRDAGAPSALAELPTGDWAPRTPLRFEAGRWRVLQRGVTKSKDGEGGSLVEWVLDSALAALWMAAVSTLGDFIWARWIPTHQTWVGIVHGTLVCLCLGAVLGSYLGTARAIRRCAAGALGVGLVAAGSFYLLWPLLHWTAMFVAWLILWILMGWLLQRVGRLGEGIVGATVRGALAAILSGLAFYAISGIWLRPDPDGPDYLVHFGSWFVAFLPGFLPLLYRLPDREDRSVPE